MFWGGGRTGAGGMEGLGESLVKVCKVGLTAVRVLDRAALDL